MKRFTAIALTVLFAGSMTVPSQAATKYWDINGSTPGVGVDGSGFNDGTWDFSATNWSPSAAGDVATEAWLAGDDAIFSAGTDATDANITIPTSTALSPSSVTIEEGIVRIAVGSTLNLVSTVTPTVPGTLRINQGATLVYSGSGSISIGAVAGHVLTLDGGTIRNSAVGVGNSFYTSPVANPTQIQLTSNGGTLDVPNGASDAYSIMQYGAAATATVAINPAVIGMTSGTTAATLRKTGAGEFRALKNWTFTKLEVQQGLYRILGDSPSPTPGPGQGGGETGFGAATGTVETFGGAVENTTNGSALGTSIGLTGANASPITRSFILGGTGDTMIVLNAGWTINGPISGPGGLMLNGWARNDGGGTTNIIGSQAQLLTLGGSNSYAGPTTINFGTLAATGGAAIPDTSKVKISTRSGWGGNVGIVGTGVVTTLNTAVFRVDASETIGSLEGGNATRGAVTINGAAVVLTTGADNSSSTFEGTIGGAGALSKTGSGTFTMNGLKTYTGDTRLLAGGLSTNSASLADAADLYLSPGTTFNLNFSGTDTIDSFFIDGVAQAVGTWGGVGSAATNISNLLTGTGLLQVTTLPAPPGIAGDYNNNQIVDAADYSVWRDNNGTNATLPNDSTPGTVTQADYDVWVANFNLTPPPAVASASAVPEPTTLGLLASAVLGVLAFARRK